jgi:hypothetical protein
MKLNKNISIIAAVVLGMLSGCSLDTEPNGSTVSQEQYEKNIFSSESHIRGLYKIMIEYGDHDVFGQKSIDIKTDMISGDMALTSVTYGWFYSSDMLAESYAGSGLTAYMWRYYYRLIKNCNLIIAAKGDADLENPTTPEETVKANYIGQAYAMRGYAYYCLSYFYASNQFGEKAGLASNSLDNPCVPIYDENSVGDAAQPLSSVERVLGQAEGDLLLAINYLKNYSRESLTMVNQDVAKVMLAYLYVYRAHRTNDAAQKGNDIDACLQLCDDIINSGKYPLLPYEKVTTTGFNNIGNEDWMWGQDITTETATGLGTFWGQVDVFTYSYALAGDVKAIDKNLYAEVDSTDMRVYWWDAKEKLAPTGKFYDKKREKGGDRLWLNDIVFMRSEEVYLIAAEAANLKGSSDIAAQYLFELVKERDKTLDVAALEADIYNQLIYNWRVEMWGEGKAYFVMKRFEHSRKRGDNHYYLKGEDITAYDKRVCFQIPSSEVKYNPNLSE